MTILSIFVLLTLGIVLLISGFITKNRWLKILSIILLAIALGQFLFLFLMSIH